MKPVSRLVLGWILAATLGGIAATASAQDYQVYVGYADGVRSGGFFPNPWNGDPNVQHFLGNDNSSIDAGAILVQNTSSSSVTLTDALVDNFDTGATYQIWGGLIGSGATLSPGKFLILTSTVNYDFDTSEQNFGSPGSPSPTFPHVHLTIDGVTTSFIDSGQVINTSGFDYAAVGNESFQWRLIGTTGGPGGPGVGTVPEPGAIATALVMAGGLGMGLLRARRKS